LVREANELQRQRAQEARWQKMNRDIEERARRKAAFKKFKQSGPCYPEYVVLLKKVNRGPMPLKNTIRFQDLNDMFNSPRSRTNFYKLMGWDDHITPQG